MDDQYQNPEVQPPPNPQPSPPSTVESQQPQTKGRITQPSDAFIQEMKSSNDNDKPQQAIAAPQPAKPSVNSIYPDATRNIPKPSGERPFSNINVTGEPSSYIMGERGTPMGIYVIAVLLLVGLLLDFRTNGTDAALLDGLLLINVILAAGLIAKKNICRQITIILTIIVIISTGLKFALLPVQQAVSQRNLNIAQADLNKLKNSSMNISRQYLSSQQTEINSTQELINQDKQGNTRDYITFSITILIYLWLVIYLTRPKVKAVFT